MAKSSGGVHYWSETETHFMLTQLQMLNISKYMDGRKTRNGDLFLQVSKRMEAAGFRRTSEQIRVRWKNVKQQYYRASLHRAAATGPHHRILEELLGRRVLVQAEERGLEPGLEALEPRLEGGLEGGLEPQGSGHVSGEGESPEEMKQEPIEAELSGRSSPLSSSPPDLDLPRPPSGRRRRPGCEMDRFLRQMQRMQQAWMEQFQQSQEREERLVRSILQSNEGVVSTLVEAIRSLQDSLPTAAPPEASQ